MMLPNAKDYLYLFVPVIKRGRVYEDGQMVIKKARVKPWLAIPERDWSCMKRFPHWTEH
jgi:hypothetical protein